ncbi:substrate-binding periplasmic protein [Chitinibacteraceae bacterium HSL-7]
MRLLRGVLLLAALSSGAGRAAELTAYTEQFPPFNYIVDGRPSGLAIDVFRAVTKRAGIRYGMRFLPWMRAVEAQSGHPDSVLFTTVRLPERESSYRWVGPIDQCDIVLMKLTRRTDVHVHDLGDARRYRIGVPAAGADVETLSKLGFDDSQLVRVPPNGNLTGMLIRQRFDLVSGIHVAYAYQARREGLPVGSIEAVATVQPGKGCYFAFNRNVNPALFDAFSTAFDALQRDGTLARMHEAYLR